MSSNIQRYHISPDYRRNPKTDSFCAHCQRDLLVGTKFMRVSIDWDLMECWADNNGKHRMGMNCWRQIQKHPVNQ